MRNIPKTREPSFTGGKSTRRWLGAILTGVMCTPSPVAAAGNADVLTRSIALYPTLTSYADTGTVVAESPGVVDRSKFRTYHRRESLDYFFDFQRVTTKSGTLTMDMSHERIVLWMIKGELQAFNQVFGSHETFSRESGNQVGALRGAQSGTDTTSILIPALIFANSNLPSTVLQIAESTDAGFEAVGGRRCHKVIGIASEYYPSGQAINVRQVTVWIDAETLLIRKVFEDTPKGYPAISYFKRTITIEPQLNPKLDDSKFQFAVPEPKQQ